MRLARPLLLLPGLLSGFLTSCAEAPFIDTGAASTTVTSIDKPTDTLLKSGSFQICHASETPMGEVVALAVERCGGYGLKASQGATQRWQCRVSAPHMTEFSCFDPNMTDEEGHFVNPFDRVAVTAWEKRTGKKAKLQNPNLIGLPTPSQPAVSAPAENPAEASPTAATGTPSPAVQLLSPEDIAGKPRPAEAPVLAPMPPPPAAPVDSGFTLPQGNWDDAFKQQ